MKRLLCAIMLMLSLVFALSACSEDAPQEPIITVSDDGYLVVNGVKTEYEVKNKNHSFGEWKLSNKGETDCASQLFYRLCLDCGDIEWREGEHIFKSVTTKPTCQAAGYDTKTCKVCGKVEVCNETPISDHDYNTEYSIDNSFHWHKCKNCDEIDGRVEHTLGDDGICTVCNEVVVATEGVVYDFSADGTCAIVLDYVGTATKIKIADEYKGVPVKEIYNEAFENTSITSVIIPNSVTSIGNSAFYGCDSLTSVVIGDSVTSIGSGAFFYCSSLASVVIGDSVTSIGSSAFRDCSSLASVVIPDSVTSMGDWAFSYCSSLASVVIGDGVTSIGSMAFFYCSSLTSVVIGDSVTSIGSSAFDYCNSALYTEYEYGKYVKSGDNPYAVLIKLTNKNLSTYEIHTDTKIIANGVFWDCDRLSSIKIPDSVTSIGDGAFRGCTSLTDVYYTGTEAEWADITIGDYNDYLTRATKHYNYIPEE